MQKQFKAEGMEILQHYSSFFGNNFQQLYFRKGSWR
jgi:hypothetical protein